MDGRGSHDNGSSRSNRRGFLTSGAALLGVAWLPTVGAGRKRSKRKRDGERDRGGGRGEQGKRRNQRDPYERSLALRERGSWSNAEWRASLSKRGIRHGTRDRRYAVPSRETDGSADGTGNSSGEVTTQKLDRYELTVHVTYSRPWYAGYDVIDVEWEFTNQEFDDFPQSPADNVAISFRPDHYAPTAAREEWVYYGEACGDPSGIDSKTPGGAVCAWRDYQDWDDESYFGVYVEPNWGEFDDWERRVYVDFVHTWSGYGLTGVSVGPGGLSMGFSEDTERWDVEDSAAEARLLDGKRITG